jgi:hypothetical protein
MLAAAQLLAPLWDAMPLEEVTANLADRGWDEGTGGPPVDPLPLGDSNNSAAAAATAGAGAGTSGVVAAAVAAAMEVRGGGSRGDRGVGHGRGAVQAVPVAPVTLGRGWAQEISRQEVLMQQQQQQQRSGSSAGGGGAAGAMPAQQRSAAAAAGVQQLLLDRPVSNAAAGSLAAAVNQRADASVLLQLQRYRQRRTWPYSTTNGAVASMSYLAGGAVELVSRPGKAHALLRQVQPLRQLQQRHHLHSGFSRMMQQNSSAVLRSSSSSGGSLRARAGRALTAAAAAAAVRLCRRGAGAGGSSSDSSRRQRGMRAMAV